MSKYSFQERDIKLPELRILPCRLLIAESVNSGYQGGFVEGREFLEFRQIIENLIIENCDPIADEELRSSGIRQDLIERAENDPDGGGRVFYFGNSRYFLVQDENNQENKVNSKVYSYDQDFEIAYAQLSRNIHEKAYLILFQLRNLKAYQIINFLDQCKKQENNTPAFLVFLRGTIRDFKVFLDSIKLEIMESWITDNDSSEQQFTQRESVMLFYVLFKALDIWPQDVDGSDLKNLSSLIARVTGRNRTKIRNKMKHIEKRDLQYFASRNSVRKYLETLDNESINEVLRQMT